MSITKNDENVAGFTSQQQCPELACYGLAGHSANPGDLAHEAHRAEDIGLGSILLSERFGTKDAAVMAGIVAGASTQIGIGTAATNHNTRHPMVTATMAVTAHRATGGRYALGLGRGFDILFDVMGVPRVTSAQMDDAIGIYRTLWSGGSVIGHSGPAGDYPYLSLGADYHEHIPIIMVALGEKSLRRAGRIADAVVLHTFFSEHATRRAVELIRHGAREAGRDPASVRIWSVMATIEESIDETARLRKLAGRLATYLQGYGDVLVKANGWDQSHLAAFREDPVVNSVEGALDATDDLDVLRHLADILPDDWLNTAAIGSAEHCASRIAEQLDYGVDSVVLHGATPDELAPVVAAWKTQRNPSHFDHLPTNPGWSTR